MKIQSDFLKFAINTAKKVGQIQTTYFGNINSFQTKSNNIDLLTKADTESERLIINSIKDKYPTHSIISEERKKIVGNDDFTWIIDPLDGTTNFVHNLPIFSVEG